ncbi:MAG: hypothetical protein AAGD22_01360 [Verrucomicrobiota bacterium]
MYGERVNGSAMIWKLTGAAIIVFWVVMTGQLARLMLNPEGSSLAEVPPVFVMDLFLGRGETSPLVVLQGGRQVGEVSVGTNRVVLERLGDEMEMTQVNVAGFLEVDHPMIEADSISGKVRFDVADDLTLLGLGLFVRQPGSARAVDIEYRPDPVALVYRVLERGEVVEELRPLEDPAMMVQAQMLLGMWGMSGVTIPADGGASLLGGREEGAVSLMRAYHGQVIVREQRFHAYVVDLGLGGQRSIRLTFSEAGELMRVETGLDYELLAEVFVADGEMEEIEGF